jgi:fructose-1,6-bisphosphatase/inositol monophosphatase family enzyme
MEAGKMDIEQLLIGVAKDGGELLRSHAFEMGEITMKRGNDPVTSLDRAVEQSIRENVLNHMPANFIGEELGKAEHGADYTWIIDPIDGTKSMIAGEFNTSLSIGIEHGHRLIAGCVYDFMRAIMYVGYDKELHVYHNDREVVHSRLPHNEARIIIDGNGVRDTAIVKAFQQSGQVKIIEKNGSIALAMAQVASGVYDGMVYKTDNRWNIWDIAGWLYLLNCTGQALDLDLEPLSHDTPQQGIIGVNCNLLLAPIVSREHWQTPGKGYMP